MSAALRLLAIMVVLPLGLFAQASNRPDFSGTWNLDLPRSRFGDIPEPKSLVIQIAHREPQIRILAVTTTDKGEERETLELTTDGKQHALVAPGPPCVATARWDQLSRARLIVEVNCADNSRSRHFILGAKGKILTTVRRITDRSGEKKVYEFFYRQGN
jgi:hypothetical protein